MRLDRSSMTEATPFTFQVFSGSVVQVSVQDSAGKPLRLLGDGSTQRAVTITVSGPVKLQAYVLPRP